MVTREYAYTIFNLLKEHYPDAKMILKWGNNWELLVAIILSAQCTDKKVNEVTAKVFPKYRQERKELKKRYEEYIGVISSKARNLRGDPHVANAPQDDKLDKEKIPHYVWDDNLDFESIVEIVNFALVPLEELEQDIKSTGFYHNKAKNIQAASKVVLEKYHGILPRSIAELTTIPGVGRKTANVFLGNAYGIYEGIAVDTHVTKQSQVLGLSAQSNPEKIEQDLMKLFDQKDWFTLTYLLIEHGRNMRRKKSDRIVCDKNDCLLCKNSY